ncbi:protease Do-like 8, chloroplastic isoform X2 [Zingiber officinale]|uniref:protease Do-like 8, chloroplastic isoform X2 n=1 Tax=Zingiber officinale TaxID=94328 RepID=UPI001C4AD589|nr:protease Do-like 8, chloroplastic isoform X2 [Zingiber officinale]
MSVLASNRPPLRVFRDPSCVGRRELLSNSVSSISSRRATAPAPDLHLASRSTEEQSLDLTETMLSLFPFTTRRVLFSTTTFSLFLHTSKHLSVAHALGDSSVTTEDVASRVFLSGPLFPSEERTVEIFEKNTYSVVNIFDVTLRPRLNATGSIEVPEGNGSGVVWDNNGHIVTNYHVVGNALSRSPGPGQVVARVNILVAEGLQKTFEGRLVGANRAKDLAVLKVDAPAEFLKPINLGQSSSLRVGQQCLAIGNPFGFDHTLTVGVISGLNRDISSKTGATIGGGIQTDAAINPGNSGGPLLDSKGNMIGINTAIFTNTGASAGVGFAIPSSTVLRIVPQLIQFGKVVRAGLNAEIAPDPIANQLNVRNGALVLQVPGNSIAAQAGLLPTTRGLAGNIVLGDIIVAVNDKPVRSRADLLKAFEEYNVGDTVLLKIQRGNQSLELPLVLEETGI